MDTVFLTIVNMSITASWLVLVVLILRLVLKKAPKALICALWSLVGFRLICPFSFESVFSLIPSTQTVSPENLYSDTPSIDSGIPLVNSTVNPLLVDSLPFETISPVNPMQMITCIAAIIWIIGITGMLLYAAISYRRVYRQVAVSLALRDNLYLCDSISTPFIFGIIRPRIYLPSSVSERDADYIIAHEQAHLNRHDHWWKPLGFILLTIYWFNPLLWIAYWLLCRDIELACDEHVIKDMDTADKAAYTTALLNCSVKPRFVTACPLAFGEVGVKSRIKSALHYKKPAFWIIIAAMIACIAVAVCFLTDPLSNSAPTVTNSHSELEGVSLEILELTSTDEEATLQIRWINNTDRDLMLGDSFSLYRDENGHWVDCHLAADSGFYAIGYLLSAHGTFEKTYNLSEYNLSKGGNYRFESHCLIHGGDTTQYTVSVEFILEEGRHIPISTDDVEYRILSVSEDTLSAPSALSYPHLTSETHNFDILNSLIDSAISTRLHELHKQHGKDAVINIRYTVTLNSRTLVSTLFEGTVGETEVAFTLSFSPSEQRMIAPDSLFIIHQAFIDFFKREWLSLWDDANLTYQRHQEIISHIENYNTDALAARLREAAEFALTPDSVIVIFCDSPKIGDYMKITVPYDRQASDEYNINPLEDSPFSYTSVYVWDEKATTKIAFHDGILYCGYYQTTGESYADFTTVGYIDRLVNGQWERVEINNNFADSPYLKNDVSYPLNEPVGELVIYTDNDNRFFARDTSQNIVYDMELNLADWRQFASDNTSAFAMLSAAPTQIGENYMYEVRIYSKNASVT